MTYLYDNTVLQIFAKAPVPGLVKTRLMPELNALEAMQVHQRLTERTLSVLSTTGFCAVELWCSPDHEHPYFKTIARTFPVTLKTQTMGGLGQRMLAALSEGIAQFGSAVLIGSDIPSLQLEDIAQALQAITGSADSVLAPTEDGGYCLIGLKQVHPALFEGITWSGPDVAAQTRLRIQQLQLSCYELRKHWDVDVYADYLRFLALEGK